jgi:hypothetical protein
MANIAQCSLRIQVLPTYDVWGLAVLSMTMLLRGHAWCSARAEDVDFQRFYTVVLQVCAGDKGRQHCGVWRVWIVNVFGCVWMCLDA